MTVVTPHMRSAFMMAGLFVGVTAIGVAIGAYGVAPIVDSGGAIVDVAAGLWAQAVSLSPIPLQKLIAAVAFTLAAVLIGWSMILQRRDRTDAPKLVTKRPAMAVKTPRDVQVLAAQGSNPVEIALRTRMPVDAVAMLMSIGRMPESAAR